MFGIVYITYEAIIAGLARINTAYRDASFKSETYNVSTGLYNDSKMKTYDSTNHNRLVHVEFNPYGRTYVVDAKTNERYRDLTQEMMDKEYETLKANPDPKITVVKWSVKDEEGYDLNDRESKPCGARYKDIKTGDIYLKRFFGEHQKYFKKGTDKYIDVPSEAIYMNIEDGMLIRPADDAFDWLSKYLYKKGASDKEIQEEIDKKKKIIDKWIDYFNARQKERLDKGLRERDPLKFYCNLNTH